MQNTLSDDENQVEKRFPLLLFDLEGERGGKKGSQHSGEMIQNILSKNSFVSEDWVITSEDSRICLPFNQDTVKFFSQITLYGQGLSILYTQWRFYIENSVTAI